MPEPPTKDNGVHHSGPCAGGNHRAGMKLVCHGTEGRSVLSGQLTLQVLLSGLADSPHVETRAHAGPVTGERVAPRGRFNLLGGAGVVYRGDVEKQGEAVPVLHGPALQQLSLAGGLGDDELQTALPHRTQIADLGVHGPLGAESLLFVAEEGLARDRVEGQGLGVGEVLDGGIETTPLAFPDTEEEGKGFEERVKKVHEPEGRAGEPVIPADYSTSTT